jgi:hypothetical protein
MENVDWNAIFEIAKKHLKGGAKKKVVAKKLKGGVQKYKCPWGDYNPPRPLKADFTMHIIASHGPELRERFPTMTDAQLERIASEAASELKFRSDVVGSEPTKKRAQESFGKIVHDIVGPEVTPTDEKTGEEPVEIKESEEEKKFKKLLEEEEAKKAKTKKEADWMSEIKKAENPPAGLPDIAKLLSKEIEPKGEEDPYVKLAKDTVKNIKKKEKANPASQANKKALSKARKIMEDSKIEPVPAPIGIKVIKKGTRTKKLKPITKPNDGRTVPSKATRGIGLMI